MISMVNFLVIVFFCPFGQANPSILTLYQKQLCLPLVPKFERNAIIILGVVVSKR